MAQDPRFRHAPRSAVVIALLFALTPSPARADGLSTPSDRVFSDELELLKEEESVDIELREKQAIPPSSSEPYVMTEEDIRESGATDLPSLLRRILGLDVSQVTDSGINRRARVDSQRSADRFLVVVDGRPTQIDPFDALAWKHIPVSLPDVKRLELWKESASATHGFHGYEVVIKIVTKTRGDVRE